MPISSNPRRERWGFLAPSASPAAKPAAVLYWQLDGGALPPKVNDMKTSHVFLVGALMGISLATPVLAAADNACLQNNRIWGWKAVDDRTLVVTDRNYKRFTVHLTGGCIGLDKYAGASLVVRTATSLSCLMTGDRIAFNSPGLGPLTCVVTDTNPGEPSPPPG